MSSDAGASGKAARNSRYVLPAWSATARAAITELDTVERVADAFMAEGGRIGGGARGHGGGGARSDRTDVVTTWAASAVRAR